MTSLAWVLAGTLLMASLAWVGLAVLALRSESLHRILPALVAFAAGSLLGGSFLHLMPETLLRTGPVLEPFLWLLTGFVAFFLLEQFLHWRHDHGMRAFRHEPVTHLILLADGMHNFLGGLAIGGSFLISPRVGFVTWLAAAAHEIPQELGDFAILLRGGWEARRALLFNFASALTVVPGGLLAYVAGRWLDVTFLLPLAAGNFLYIAASDLIPEIKHGDGFGRRVLHLVSFVAGILTILAARIVTG